MSEYDYYKNKLEELELKEEEKKEYQEILENIGENAKTPIIFNTYHLSNILGVKWDVIKKLINNTNEMYHTFSISKKSGRKETNISAK